MSISVFSLKFLDFFSRISLDTLMVQQSRAIPWEERIPKVFFRGRDSNQARLDLVRKYWNQTDRFNVSLTSFFFFEYKEELYGPKTPRISQLEFFKVSESGMMSTMI